MNFLKEVHNKKIIYRASQFLIWLIVVSIDILKKMHLHEFMHNLDS